MKDYKVEKNEELKLQCSSPLSGMFKLSPFVWKENGIYNIMLRAVNPSGDATQKVARAYFGTSKDGLHFNMNDGPAIAPGTNSYDKDGCEDPTVICVNNNYLVYYTGWNQTKMEGQLLLSEGKKVDSLSLKGIAIPSHEPYINPKEATVAQLKNGKWMLLFEYANESRSKLGRAFSENPDGPWKIEGEFLPAVENSWDSYHLSPGPVLTDSLNQTVMFYNGSNANAHWRIGWVIMDAIGNVTKRSESPLITPPLAKGDDTDIAFAASAVLVGKEIWLYYSIADKSTHRAIITLED
jgi:predicted GH43/DUF377 family glycosyl hydrolase